MNIRPTIQILLLVACMQLVSAYKFRCWMFCTDQTAIQNDYINDRDSCRSYAQLRIETDTSNPELIDDRSKSSKLVSLFSSCMADKGWTVPDGVKPGQQAAAPIPVQNSAAPAVANAASQAPAPAAPTAAAPAVATNTNAATLAAQRREKAFLARSSECAFARHGAAYSSVSAARAQACDIECKERLKAAPDSPRAAACPADANTISSPR